MAPATEHLVILGRIVGLHGVQGWVKVYSDTQPRENILRYSPWLIQQDGNWLPVKLLAGRKQGKGIVAHLDGWHDRERSRALLDCQVAIQRSQLPGLAADEVYWADLVGLTAVDTRGNPLGRVESLFETGANDVLVLKGDRERLVPYIKDVVQQVDLEKGRIVVDWDKDF